MDGNFGLFDTEEEQPKKKKTVSTSSDFGLFSTDEPVQDTNQNNKVLDSSFGLFDGAEPEPVVDPNAEVTEPNVEVTEPNVEVTDPNAEVTDQVESPETNNATTGVKNEVVQDDLSRGLGSPPNAGGEIPSLSSQLDSSAESNSLVERLNKDKGKVRNTLKPYTSTYDAGVQSTTFLENELANIKQDKEKFEEEKRIKRETKEAENKLRTNLKKILESTDPKAVAFRDKIFNIKNPRFTEVSKGKDGNWYHTPKTFTGNISFGTPQFPRKISELEAAMLIHEGNNFKASNFALNRGWGNLKQATNVMGYSLGFKDPDEFFKRMSELNRVYPLAPKKIRDGLKEIQEAEGWAEAFKAIVRNPQAMVSVVGESLVTSSPTIAAFIAGSLVTRNQWGGAALSTPVAFATEYALTIKGEIDALDINLDNDEDIKALMQNKEFWKKARAKGIARGIPIAIFDALSMGLAGKLVAPALREGWKKVAVASGAEALIQAGAGSLGEAGAEVGEMVIGQRDPWDFKEGDILLEGGAEILPGMGEMAVNLSQTNQKVREAQAEKEYELEIQKLASELSSPEILAEVDPSKVLMAERVEKVAQEEKTVSQEISENIEKKKKAQKAPKLEIDNPQAIPPEKEIGLSLNAFTGNVEEEQIQTPGGEKIYSTEFVLVDIRQLKQAQGQLQPRNRATKESKILAIQRANEQTFNAKRLMDSPTTGDGSPIIAKDGTIISGNGRVLTMAEVYDSQDNALTNYKTELESFITNKIAKDLNVAPTDPKVKEDVAKILNNYEQPILVRRLTDPNMTVENLSEMADLSNRSEQAVMSVTESASRDAKAMGDEITRLYTGGELTSAENRAFVQAFVNRVVTKAEQGEFTKNGQLTNQAVNRMKSAILASAFSDVDVLTTMLESPDNNIKALTNALVSVAPKFTQLKSKIEQGNIKPEFDITSDITNTAQVISELRNQGIKPSEYFAQQDMYTNQDPMIEALIKAFYNDELTRANSQQFMETVLNYYIEETENVGQQNQLFADEVSPKKVVEGARRRTVKERQGETEGQGKLFGEEKGNESSTQEGGKQVSEPVSKRGSDDTGSVNKGGTKTQQKGLKGEFPQPNDSGVFSKDDVKPEDRYFSKLPGSGFPDVELTALEVAPGEWVNSYSIMFSNSGSSRGLQNLRPSDRFSSKEEAIQKAIEENLYNLTERPDDTDTVKKQRIALKKFFDKTLKDIEQGDLIADTTTRKIGKVDTEMDQGGLESTQEPKQKKERKEGSTRGTKKGRITLKEMQTLRQSVFHQAFTDAGIEPSKAVNLEPKRQFKIVSDLVKEKFGFKYVAKGEVSFNAVQSLLDAYRNLQFMSHVLGLPNEKMSLDGEVGLALPTRAGYNAAYYPTQVEGAKAKIYDAGILEIAAISMPGRSNSFAHEWGHALDYHLVKKYGTEWARGITGRIRTNLKGNEKPWLDTVPKSVQETMADLINAMFFDKADLAAKVMELEQKINITKKWEAKTGKSTQKLADLEQQLKRVLEGSTRSEIGKSQYRKDAENFAKTFGYDPNYWTRPTEMFARVFEAYVANKVANVEGTTEFITKSDPAYKMTIEEVEGADARLALTYPNDQDRRNMFLAMDRLMEAIRADHWTGVQGANRPEDKNMVDARLDFYGQLNEGASKSKLKSLIPDEKLAWRMNKAEKERRSDRPREYDKGILANTWHRTEDYVFKNVLYSKRGVLFAISRRNRNNPQIHKIVEDIISRVATDPGGTRKTFTGGVYEEAVRINTRRFATELKNILRRNKLNLLSKQQMKDLRLVLTGNAESIQNIPQNIIDGAAEIRIKILNPVYDYARQNNLPLTYLEDGSYLPRVLDMALFNFKENEFKYGSGENVSADNPSMTKGAYGLYHQVIYKNEVGQLDIGSRQQQMEMFRIMADNTPVTIDRLKRGSQIFGTMMDNAENFAEGSVTAEDVRGDIRSFAKLVPTIYSLESDLKLAKENPKDNAKQIEQLEKQIAKLDQQLEEIHEGIYTMLQPAFADVATNDWVSRITEQQGNDVEAHSSMNKFMKQRKLPKEADTFMIDFYTDPIEALTTYIPSVVRKVEQENRFGSRLIPKGKPKKDQAGNNIDYLQYQLNRAKNLGLNDDDAKMIKDNVDVILGRSDPIRNRKAKVTSDFLYTMGTMSLLGRAVMSSIAEPLTIGIQTGSSMKALKNMGYLLDEGLSGLTSKERTQYFRQLSNILGVVDDPEVGEMVANRLGGTLQDSPTMNKWLSRYFVNTKLQGLTNAQRRSSMRVFLQYFVELSKEYKDTNTSDKKMKQIRNVFQDLGITGQDLDQFTSFMLESREQDPNQVRAGFKAPKLEDIMGKAGELSDMGKLLSIAINRAVSETIQDPMIVDRPKYAEHPVGRFVYGIQSFSRAYTRNVLLASVNKVKREYRTNGAVSATTMASLHIMPQFALLYAGHFAVSTAREAMFNGDEWERQKENDNVFPWLMEVAWTRAGFFGALDPIYQAFRSLKYESDIKNLVAGAQAGFLANALDRIFTMFGQKNSPNTLTAEYNATRGFMDTIGSGFISLIAATTPGNIAGTIAGSLAFFGTSSGFKKWISRKFVETVYGDELEIGGKKSSKKSGQKQIGSGGSKQRQIGK